MSDPQPLTANDADTVRAIAERYPNHPEITTNLHAAADYLAILQRGSQPGASESSAVQPAVGETCPMTWAVPTTSVAAGINVREEICGRPASEPVEYDGALYVVCSQCKGELVGMGGQELRKTT